MLDMGMIMTWKKLISVAVFGCLICHPYQILFAERNRPEARAWMKENKSEFCPLAANRFLTRESAEEFVDHLYGMGAVKVWVDNISEGSSEDRHSDTLIVELPKDAGKRKELFKLLEEEADSTEYLEKDKGQEEITFWWD